ncbi:hypothetical protein ACQKPE_02930 [Pseudomonas sp. NPDC089554]|uniref:hypothetical protein n=1 Tax=Pseudomonas sp. NPDC089554 TaxID=3390653 RepID=UPI003D0190AB
MKPYWKKLGQLYCPSEHGRHEKLLTHAANPLPVHLRGDVYRVFYSGRDRQNRSSVGAVDIDIVRREVVKDHLEPFFVHGEADSFYRDGVSIGNCYKIAGKTYMLFMGWQAPADSHWRGDIGRLEVLPDLRLRLTSPQPFIAASDEDPISLSYPWVIENTPGSYDMWYGSTLTWDAGNGEMAHVIKHACSVDGDNWKHTGLAVPYELSVAQAFSRPTVVKDERGGYQMWFSYRSGAGEKYRIGSALSDDGKSWRLALQSSGIEVSCEGWDSDMIEYPFVLDHKGERYMLYNGNGYGKTGFGMAAWVDV